MQLAGEAVFAGAGRAGAGRAEEALVGDGSEVFGVGTNQVVERAIRFGDGGLELVPACFDDFEEDVILQLVDEVDHLGNTASRDLPVPAQYVIHAGENAPGAGHAPPPCAAEREFDALDSPEEIEDDEILLACPRCNHDIDGSIDFVFQGEDVPANITVAELEETGVEAAEHVGGVELGVGPTNGVV